MDNQHKKISGYRDLSQTEIDLMNRIKEQAELCGKLIDSLSVTIDTDQEYVENAKLNLQQGFMWAVRSVAKPTTFG